MKIYKDLWEIGSRPKANQKGPLTWPSLNLIKKYNF